jgi:hypothetical protein
LAAFSRIGNHVHAKNNHERKSPSYAPEKLCLDFQEDRALVSGTGTLSCGLAGEHAFQGLYSSPAHETLYNFVVLGKAGPFGNTNTFPEYCPKISFLTT